MTRNSGDEGNGRKTGIYLYADTARSDANDTGRLRFSPSFIVWQYQPNERHYIDPVWRID